MNQFRPVSTRYMTELFTDKNKSGLTRDLIEALFPMFEEASAGAIAVDRHTRITWINSSYSHLLGLGDPAQAIGKPVRQVIPQTRMPEVVETGKPLLLDIMEHNQQQLVVTRLPYYDQQGEIEGAVAFVLYDDLQPLTPLVSKYRRLHRDLAAARKALAKKARGTRYSLGDFVGGSPAALEVKRRARLAAGRDMPVLLLGETGTGKEVLAQAIHAVSPRVDKPFVGVNVAAIPENLLEAEFLVWRRVPIPALTGVPAMASSSWPTGAPCSWTRWATCRCHYRQNCCAPSRREKLNPWVQTRWPMWTFGSSRQPAETWSQ